MIDDSNSSNYPLLSSVKICQNTTSSEQQARYKNYGYIPETEEDLKNINADIAEDNANIVFPALVDYKISGVPLTPSVNNIERFLTPTGTPKPTPTPTSQLLVTFNLQITFNIFTELEIILNLSTKKLILKHLKEGKLPLNPINIKTSNTINSITTKFNEKNWTIPWSTSLNVDRQTNTSISNVNINKIFEQNIILINYLTKVQNLNEFTNIKIIQEDNIIYFTGLWTDKSNRFISVPVKIPIQDYVFSSPTKIQSQLSDEYNIEDYIISQYPRYETIIVTHPVYLSPPVAMDSVITTNIDSNNILRVIVKDNNQDFKNIDVPWSILIRVF